MSFKVGIVTVLLVLATRARAGGPAAYTTYTTALDAGSIGSTHESTLKGHGGNSVVSQFSKAVDTPYSSVRKFDTRISNDAAYAYAAPAYSAAAPALYGSYAAPAAYSSYAAPAAVRAYAAPALSAYRSYAPAAAYSAYAAPAAYSSYAAPAIRAYAAPAAAAYRSYAAPAALGYSGYAPAYARAAVAAPLGVSYSAAPAVAHLSFSGLGASYGW